MKYRSDTILLFHQENWAVVPASRRLNDAKSQPFTNLVLKITMMGFWNLELFYIDGLLHFHE
jgi:hypothetical protein